MPQRNITESVIYIGTATGTGYVMEMLDETMEDNTLILTGLGVGALSFAGSMFIRNNLAETALDSAAASSFAFVGSKVREAGTLAGLIGGGTQTATAASGSPRVVRVNNNGNSQSNSNQSSNSRSSSNNVVEM